MRQRRCISQSPEAAGQFHLSRHHPHDIQSAPNPRSELSQQQQQQPGYEPFGRPGAGAPLRDRDGRIVPSRGLIEQSLNRRLEESQQRKERRWRTRSQISCLAARLASRPRSANRSPSGSGTLPSSDVTHIKLQNSRHKFQSMTGYQPLPSVRAARQRSGATAASWSRARHGTGAAARRMNRPGCARCTKADAARPGVRQDVRQTAGAGAPVSAGAKKMYIGR
uniref:Uncharacterized protein n=1 Tax=Macrostomum lignano TaxID=282301 RepID=A0A1I8FDK4_9PLAT